MMLGSNSFRTRISILVLTGLLLAVSLMSTAALAAQENPIPLDGKGLPMWSIVQWNDFPVLLQLANHDDLDRLLQEVPIASFNREQVGVHYDTPKSYHLTFRPRVTEAEAEALQQAGYVFERVVDQDRIARQEAEVVWAQQYNMSSKELRESIKEFTYWPTHAQIGTFLADLATDYPSICRSFSWGQSVQGRDLYGLVVSNDPNHTTAEAEVRLSSTMHGDEVPGMVMLLNFAEYLVTNYGQAGFEDVTNLVDNYEIHIMPLYNPDGMTADQRSNANGVDLNRNYLLPDGDHATREIETTNFMTYANNHHFVISQNGHSGALVANYPWDYTPVLAPDDEALKLLSLEYSTYNSPMYNGSFPQGITNGYDWYYAAGTLQDWSYDQTDCIDVTMELSNTKWPSASVLPSLWNENRESLMHYVKAARYGVNGVVTGSDTGLPLAATVTVTGNIKNTHTDPTHGDYYKLLETGTFELTFSADGYITQTISNVATTWGTPTVLDVVLDPVAHGDVSGRVANASGTGVDASINIYSHPVGTYVTTVQATAASDGAYTAHLIYGDYRLEAVSSGLMTQSALVTISGTPATQDFTLNGVEEVVLFTDNFESGTSQWDGLWGLTNPAEGYNSANSLNDSPGSNYDSGANSPMTMSDGVDLTDAMSGEVSFRAKWEIENSWDGCFFEVSIDGGGTWTPLATGSTNACSGQGAQLPSGAPIFDNNQANWVLNTVSLTPYLGETDVRFRFRLVSDSSIVGSGFFVDDFLIEVLREQSISDVPGASSLVAGVKAWPNPFNPQTTVEFTNSRSGAVAVGIYNVQGQLVRTLVQDQMAAGSHSVVWDGRTNVGGQAASGVYFARMNTKSENVTTKLMLVK